MFRKISATPRNYGYITINRLNSTTRTVAQILDDIPRHFETDLKLLNKIHALKSISPDTNKFTEFTPKTITLGIVQSKDIQRGLFLNTLITDPLSDDNTCVKLLNQHRETRPSTNLKVEHHLTNSHISGGCFSSDSQFLSADFRLIQDAKLGDGSGKLLNRDIFNNLSLIEINDPTFSRTEQTEGAEELILTSNKKDNQITESECQTIVYVKSESSAVDRLNDLPYFEVINTSCETENRGTILKEHLRPNTFQIDLEKLEKGNQLMAESIQNVSEYLKLYQDSNINELLYTINRETSGYKPFILLLRSLIRDLEHSTTEIDNTEILKLKQEVLDWSQNAHFELQSKVTPFLDDVLVKDLSKFSQLVYNSGDLTLVVSNLLNGTRAKINTGLFKEPIECYGSLEESISGSHYLEGKIDAVIPAADSEGSKVDQFLDDLKFQVSNEKIPALQSEINNILIKEIIAAPFTVFTVCNIGYIYDFIALNTAFALTALTAAITANTTQKKFIKMIVEFKDWYLEQLRLYIENTTVSLSQQLKSNIRNLELKNAERAKNLDELRSVLVKVEEADNILKHKQ